MSREAASHIAVARTHRRTCLLDKDKDVASKAGTKMSFPGSMEALSVQVKVRGGSSDDGRCGVDFMLLVIAVNASPATWSHVAQG